MTNTRSPCALPKLTSTVSRLGTSVLTMLLNMFCHPVGVEGKLKEEDV